MTRVQLSKLRLALERLYQTFDHVDSVKDPVHSIRRYTSRDDQEIVGFLAAALAFGRVAGILDSIEALLKVIGDRPANFIRQFDFRRDHVQIKALGHRWIRGNDLSALFIVLQRMLRESGSIEQFFLEGDNPESLDISNALESFSVRALQTDVSSAYGRVQLKPGVRYFFPRPSAGSACKRLNLFLRWMARSDSIDLGVWKKLSPARLIVPLDTHVIRVGRCLGLTHYVSPGWRMASDITASLRKIDPVDPVRFDFSLCHIGMINACRFGQKNSQIPCPLKGHCHPGRASKIARVRN